VQLTSVLALKVAKRELRASDPTSKAATFNIAAGVPGNQPFPLLDEPQAGRGINDAGSRCATHEHASTVEIHMQLPTGSGAA